MAEAIGTTGDIAMTGVTTINVTDTVITGNVAEAPTGPNSPVGAFDSRRQQSTHSQG